jgi:hypothetical protein
VKTVRGADQTQRPVGTCGAPPLRRWRSIYFPG